MGSMLLSRAAFVVEVDDCDPSHVCGQIEHVLSGERGRFESDAALLGFIRRVLAAPGQQDSSATGGKG